MLFGGIDWGQKLYVIEVNGFLAAAYLQHKLWKKECGKLKQLTQAERQEK
jgi:hypothetical protein